MCYSDPFDCVADADVLHRNWQVGGDPARTSRQDSHRGCGRFRGRL